MQLRNEIPDTFWSLFRSVNRDIYIEALLCINEEYQYNNYFLTREVCIQVLGDMNARKRFKLQWEENETEFDMLETPSSRILNWLLKTGWLKRIEDYQTLVTNIVIPDYSAVFIEAFERLSSEDIQDTEIYIQNVYATLFSFKNDSRANLGMLRTALVNTKRLNKALQDMLHNMDKFFARLLEQNNYEDLLREHLDGYVEEIVQKKYHILKTSDNFYIYKMDIKKCLRDMREDEEWIEEIRTRAAQMGDTKDDVLDLLDQIERGFDDIEHRIANMDKEHAKYVRATVTRLNYLLSGETDTKGLVVQLLNKMAAKEDPTEQDAMIRQTGERMNLSLLEILSEKSLYKRRRPRTDFISKMAPDQALPDLDKDDVLKLNRIQMRYSRSQIEEFIESYMDGEVMDASKISLMDEEAFEKLILAYDYSTRKNSKYMVLEEEPDQIENGSYKYPALKFVRRRL
ncbi:MAG: Wadjet anti-phage system protein JetA family protein [Dorea sp.]